MKEDRGILPETAPSESATTEMNRYPRRRLSCGGDIWYYDVNYARWQ